jgi:hypothetical protein
VRRHGVFSSGDHLRRRLNVHLLSPERYWELEVGVQRWQMRCCTRRRRSGSPSVS